jgi:7-cyano-7-deazaguanine synthase
MPKAVILLSGGLDSATTLALAMEQGFTCYTLSLDYGQRHNAELAAAVRIAQAAGVADHKIIRLNLDEIGGSALTDPAIAVPQQPGEGIPVTYVPARNTVFLALALGWAEVLGAWDLFIGVNAVDYSGYPDCRPEYIEAFEHLAALATRGGVEGGGFSIHAPLIDLPATGGGLRQHRFLLRGGRGRPGLRPVRCLPPARPGLPRRRGAGPDPLCAVTGRWRAN